MLNPVATLERTSIQLLYIFIWRFKLPINTFPHKIRKPRRCLNVKPPKKRWYHNPRVVKPFGDFQWSQILLLSLAWTFFRGENHEFVIVWHIFLMGGNQNNHQEQKMKDQKPNHLLDPVAYVCWGGGGKKCGIQKKMFHQICENKKLEKMVGKLMESLSCLIGFSHLRVWTSSDLGKHESKHEILDGNWSSHVFCCPLNMAQRKWCLLSFDVFLRRKKKTYTKPKKIKHKRKKAKTSLGFSTVALESFVTSYTLCTSYLLSCFGAVVFKQGLNGWYADFLNELDADYSVFKEKCLADHKSKLPQRWILCREKYLSGRNFYMVKSSRNCGILFGRFQDVDVTEWFMSLAGSDFCWKWISFFCSPYICVVVSNISCVHPYLGKWSNLTSIFFRWGGSTSN